VRLEKKGGLLNHEAREKPKAIINQKKGTRKRKKILTTESDCTLK